MVVVDSNVWIDLLRGKETRQTMLFEQRAAREEIGIPDLVLYEVLQGIKNPDAFAEVKEKLLVFPVLNIAGKEIALRAAENSIILREKGFQTRTIDCLIATFCIENGYALLSSDLDFTPFGEHLGLVLL